MLVSFFCNCYNLSVWFVFLEFFFLFPFLFSFLNTCVCHLLFLLTKRYQHLQVRRSVYERRQNWAASYVGSCRGRRVVSVDRWGRCSVRAHTGSSRSVRRRHRPGRTARMVGSGRDSGCSAAHRSGPGHSACRPRTPPSRTNLHAAAPPANK